MSGNTRQVYVGNVPIGGGAPVSVQSMTNTKTTDIEATLDQISRLQDVGCQIIRVAIPNAEAAKAFAEIKKRSGLPVVADIHLITITLCRLLKLERIRCVLIREISAVRQK